MLSNVYELEQGFCASLAVELALENCAADLLTKNGLPPEFDNDNDYYYWI